MNTLKFSTVSVLVALGVASYACGESAVSDDSTGGSGPASVSSTTGTGGSTAASGGAGGTTATTNGSGGVNFTVGTGVGGGTGGDDQCPDIEVEAEVTVKPADIIFVIDNSGSMSQELTAVEQNINTNFAQIIGASNIDYQVIMVTDHGASTYDLCVEAPLSSIPAGGCNSIGSNPPGETTRFKHYDLNVQSHDALCLLLQSFDGTEPTEDSLHPAGWGPLLRKEAVKIFVAITDDGIVCNYNGPAKPASGQFNDQDTVAAGQQVALDWDKSLLALSPGQFGTVASRNYIFYSIIGMSQQTAPKMPTDAWHYAEQVPDGPCTPPNLSNSGKACRCPSGSVAPGTGYQWLSKGTQGSRYPLCPINNVTNFTPIFKEIAAGVVSGAAVPCEFKLPEPEPGKNIDYSKIGMTYTPGMGPAEKFTQTSSAATCGMDTDKFYIEGNLIKLCPKTCDKVKNDNNAKVKVAIPCEAISN